MRKTFYNLRKNESGAVVVMVSAMLTVLLTLSALVVDYGSLYVQAAHVQTAADAAAFAAGKLLPVSENDTAKKQMILNVAEDYLALNGFDNVGDIDISLGAPVDGKHRYLEISLQATTPANFAKLFGVNELTVEKTAAVETMVAARISDVVPLSVEKTKLLECLNAGTYEHIILKYGPSTIDDSSLPSGSFGAIDLDGVNGGGANDYETWLTYGFSGLLSVGSDLFPVESGNMTGSTSTAFSSRYAQCTHFPGLGGCTADHYEPHCTRVIKVPVVEYVDSKQVQIVGFAAFVLEGQNPDYPDSITGSYVDMVTLGSAGGDTTGTASDFGVYSLMLSK
jgi:hypothetical protein